MARVLIVDDNEDLRTAWRALLEVAGHEVVEAAHGKEALSRIAKRGAPVDVVLLDLLMPEMDGRTFLDRLQREPGKKPPVIVTSEFLGLVDTPRVVARLKKPVRKEDLLVAVASAAASAETTGDLPIPARGHILVVEDDAATRGMLVRYLQGKRFQVTAVEDGHEALNVLAAVPFDLVLLDLMMPGANGHDVLRRMRATPALKKTPVIVASAAAAPEDIEHALALGADDYVTKPFDLRVLAARVEGRAKRRGSALVDARAIGPGTILDEKYAIEERVDGGGFGTVFKGKHLALQSPIAVKVLSSSARTREEVDALRAEGVAACRLQHPNAVRVHDFAVLEGGVAYLVMELLDGPSFARELTGKPLALTRVVQVVVPVCNVLAAAHAQRLVHRDVKPANVVLHRGSTGEIVKVVDFGIAAFADEHGTPREADGSVPGTLSYMAPESLAGDALTAKADVFAVGVILYEALTGEKPFGVPDVDVYEFVARVQHATPSPPSSKNPRLHAKVDEIVLSALARDPAARPTAQDLARGLREVLVYDDVAASRPTRLPVAHAALEPARKVLLVEDDDDLRAALTDALVEQGFSVVGAEDGEAGFRALVEMGACDVVLLDLQLPVLSGRGFVDRIRSYVRFRGTPVVTMTAFDTFVAPPGVAAVLKKPLDVGHVAAVLRASANARHVGRADAKTPA